MKYHRRLRSPIIVHNPSSAWLLHIFLKALSSFIPHLHACWALPKRQGKRVQQWAICRPQGPRGGLIHTCVSPSVLLDPALHFLQGLCDHLQRTGIWHHQGSFKIVLRPRCHLIYIRDGDVIGLERGLGSGTVVETPQVTPVCT